MEKFKKIFQIHLPSDLYEELRDRAFDERKSITAMIVELLYGAMGMSDKK